MHGKAHFSAASTYALGQVDPKSIKTGCKLRRKTCDKVTVTYLVSTFEPRRRLVFLNTPENPLDPLPVEWGRRPACSFPVLKGPLIEFPEFGGFSLRFTDLFPGGFKSLGEGSFRHGCRNGIKLVG